MTRCPVAAAWALACWAGELSAQPVPLGGTFGSTDPSGAVSLIDVLRAAGARSRSGGAPVALGQAYTHQRATLSRLDVDVPRVTFDDDAPRDVQAEAGALADVLGREERLERVGLDLGGHAGPGVGDLDDDPARRLVGPRRDGQGALAGHRVDGVVD